jgi:hypothetical protein
VQNERTQRAWAILISSRSATTNIPQLSSQIMSRWRRLQSNATEPNTTHTHIRCEPDFNNTCGDLLCWIGPSTKICLVTQNVQGIKPITTKAALLTWSHYKLEFLALLKPMLNGANTPLDKDTKMPSPSYMHPPDTCLSHHHRLHHHITNVVVPSYQPLTVGPTGFTFPERNLLVPEDGNTLIFSVKITT